MRAPASGLLAGRRACYGHGNALLDALCSATGDILQPGLQEVVLKKGENLLQTGLATGNVYFPVAGVVSQEVVAAAGSSVHAGMIGSEGSV